MDFSHRRSVLRPLFRTLHGLLGYQLSSALSRPVCLSSTCLSVFNLSVCLQPVCLSSTCLSVFNLSVCLQPVCLSPDSQSDCLRFFSPPHPPLVDSLDSELWYHFGCRAAALASAAPRPLGSLFGSFSPRGARSKGDQQPDGRVAHN